MPVINPAGLFHGDRLQKLSRMAYLHWPFLFVASNGYGRIEVAHHLILSRLGKFTPSETELRGYIQEYACAHLLFLYHVGQKTWGQWDTDPKFLPHWKTAEDKRSPEPPEPEYTKWLREYRLADSAPLTNVLEDFQNISSGIGIGVGVGGGIGGGKSICAATSAARVDDSPSLDNSLPEETPGALLGESKRKPTKAIKEGLTAQQDAWFTAWWAIYWRRVARKPARVAFGKLVKTEARFQEVMTATRAQTPEMLSREPSKIPHGATWLNGERWADEVAPFPIVSRSNATNDALKILFKE
jgi:hypothetical protein